MKRKNSICLSVIIVLLLVSIVITVYQKNYEKEYVQEETQMKELESTLVEQELYKYKVLENDEKLVVYTYNLEKVLFETSIDIKSLPANLQDKIHKGISFRNEEELYSFLESYSS